MKKRVIAFILIFILSCNVLIPKKVNATAVTTEVVIEVGSVLYYIIQGVITGVEVKTIVETISTGGERYTVYKKTNGSGTLYKFVNGNKTRIRPQVAQALVDGLTDKQLVELANNVTINEEGMMTSGDISSATKKAVNGIMIDISGSVPLYENYYTQLVERGKLLTSEQIESVSYIIDSFRTFYNREDLYKYPYYAIYPALSNGGVFSYMMCFSTRPIIFVCPVGEKRIELTDIPTALNRSYYARTDSLKNVGDIINSSYSPYLDGYEYRKVSLPFSDPSYVYPKNLFMELGISAIGHGIVLPGDELQKKIWCTEQAVVAGNEFYEMPYNILDKSKMYSYIDIPKEDIVIKDGPLPVAGDIDKVVEQINDYENTDKENHVTWDNIDSAINKNLIVGVIDDYYNPGIDIPIDTPTDLSGVNKRLDEVIEKLGAILGSIGDINALTDEQLKEILKDLDLTNADGLTIEQVREYADEREQAQDKELETELDIDKFKVDNGIINKFPFCIPFDLIKVIKKMDSTATAPRFEFPFKFQRLGINETIVLDLSQFEKVAVVVRWFILVSYLLLLIYATRSLIKG